MNQKPNPTAGQAQGNPDHERAFDAAAGRAQSKAAKAPAKVNSHEAFCLASADNFVAVRGRTPSTRTRARFDSLAGA